MKSYMKWSVTYSIEKQPWRGLLLNFVYYDFVHGVNSLWPQVRSLDQSKKHIFFYMLEMILIQNQIQFIL